MKTLMIAFFIFSISSSLFANPQLVVDNHTKAYGTAQTSMSPCSSSAGNSGVMKPNSVFIVPEGVLNMFCKTSCSVKLYMNKNCNSKPIGVISFDRIKGIVRIDDHHINQFSLSGSGFNLAVDGGPKRHEFDIS